MPTVRDADYFSAKARQCFRLADACTDREAALRLRQLGHEFIAEALKLGADSSEMPADWLHPPSRRY